MGMMARMRNLAPWFILGVGGLFVLFMVITDSKVLDFIQTTRHNIGSVNGEVITDKEFSDFLEAARRNQQAATGRDIDESQMDFFRDQVWDAMVTRKLIDEKIKEFGIVVSDDEIRNQLLGPNPPAGLKQQFTDSTGTFNRQLYESALRDPRNKQIVIQLEDQIREQLVQQKLQDYLFASINVSNQELLDQFIQQNIKMKADYILVDANTIPDSTINVTKDEIKNYYDKHLDDYKIQAQRRLKYVMFRKVASKDDSTAVFNNLIAIVNKLKNDTSSFKTYAQIYSEQPYSKDTVSILTLPESARDLLLTARVGDIVGPVKTFDGYTVYKLVDKIKSKNEVVKASHILIKSTGNDQNDLKRANEIYQEAVKGTDFASLAKANSQDPGSALKGGDLGWFGKGQMVKPFEEAVYSGKVGQILKPVKTQFGYHIIKITGKNDNDFVIEKIVNKIQPSGTTLDKLYNDANDFAYIAKENSFESEAKLMNYSVIETPPFTEDATAIAGIGQSVALVKFAFDEGVGKISDVVKVPAGYVVAMVSDIIKPGFKKLEDVEIAIKNTLLRQKKIDKAMQIASTIRSKIGESTDLSIASQVYPQAKIASTETEFNSNGVIPGLGREYAFSEYSLNAELNKLSQPIRGVRGAFLIRVTSRTEFDQRAFQAAKESLRNQILQRKKNYYFSQWIQDLKKEADIVDNRYLFYR
ncbi:peptidylprolyl isomerase [Melioribacteraceae bacterium 4301-Me]|uniref:peptidylprolyl isomerase n=1 Tax=Pyranulibacter aquaticus TaxID=3163344 RepID=UPI00359609A3